MLIRFGNFTQSSNEFIQSYLICLNSAAIDCESACLECCFDLVPMNARDKFICGLFNSTLQTNIFAKATHLKTLEDVVKHAAAFKTALHSQCKLLNHQFQLSLVPQITVDNIKPLALDPNNHALAVEVLPMVLQEVMMFI